MWKAVAPIKKQKSKPIQRKTLILLIKLLGTAEAYCYTTKLKKSTMKHLNPTRY